MTRHIATIVIGAALICACDDTASNDQRLYDAMAGQIPAGDNQAASECDCFYSAMGYASVGACLAAEQGGNLTATEQTCLRNAVTGYGQFADYAECTLRASTQLATCLGGAQCTDRDFNACYMAADAAVQACAQYSPCYALTGSALTQCQTDLALLQSKTGACF